MGEAVGKGLASQSNDVKAVPAPAPQAKVAQDSLPASSPEKVPVLEPVISGDADGEDEGPPPPPSPEKEVPVPVLTAQPAPEPQEATKSVVEQAPAEEETPNLQMQMQLQVAMLRGELVAQAKFAAARAAMQE